MPTEPSDHAARATDERDLAILAALDRREPRSAICARPVVHGHAVASAHEMPTGHDFWMRHCLTMLARADRMAVLMLDGWQESTGVRAEIEQWRKWWRYEPIYLGPDNPPPAHMSLRETVDALRAVWAPRAAEVAA